MANSPSARKRARQNEQRRLANRGVRSHLRTEIKKFRAALRSGDVEDAGALLRRVHGVIDRTAKKGVIHARAASRYKSRLAKAHRRLADQAAG